MAEVRQSSESMRMVKAKLENYSNDMMEMFKSINALVDESKKFFNSEDGQEFRNQMNEFVQGTVSGTKSSLDAFAEYIDYAADVYDKGAAERAALAKGINKGSWT